MKTIRALFAIILVLSVAVNGSAQSPKVKASASTKNFEEKLYQIEVAVTNVSGINFSVPGILVDEDNNELAKFYTEGGIATIDIKPDPTINYYVKIAGMEGKKKVQFPYDDNTGFYGMDPDSYNYLTEYDYMMTPYVVEAKRVSDQRLHAHFGEPMYKIKFNRTFESMPHPLYSLIGRVPGVRFLAGENGYPKLEIRQTEPVYFLDGQVINDKQFIDNLNPDEIYEIEVWHMNARVVSVITKNG